MLSQSAFGRLASYEDVNDAERLCHDPAMRWVVLAATAICRCSGVQNARFWRRNRRNLANVGSGAFLGRPSGMLLEKQGMTIRPFCEPYQAARNLCRVLAGGVLLFVSSLTPAAAGWTFKVLYTFQTTNLPPATSIGISRLFLDNSGNLYGTTYYGGAHNQGSVFKVTPDGTETDLYSFCSAPKCEDGQYPRSGLAMDASADLYGTTWYGRNHSPGVVYRLSPDGSETVLHTFSNTVKNRRNAFPLEIILGTKGGLYGTSNGGGITTKGALFAISGDNKFRILYNFCSRRKCRDGAGPFALVKDLSGDLYGTTYQGGTHGGGTIFLFAAGTERVLYNFCAATDCADGSDPTAGLIIDGYGNLYGTAFNGGLPFVYTGGGTVFELAHDGTETTLYRFCALSNCADGANPTGGVVEGADGTLFGTTIYGGANGYGTVFEITPDGQEQVLYNFCSVLNCNDGLLPTTGLVMDEMGNLYGATAHSGLPSASNGGIVFELVHE